MRRTASCSLEGRGQLLVEAVRKKKAGRVAETNTFKSTEKRGVGPTAKKGGRRCQNSRCGDDASRTNLTDNHQASRGSKKNADSAEILGGRAADHRYSHKGKSVLIKGGGIEKGSAASNVWGVAEPRRKERQGKAL